LIILAILVFLVAGVFVLVVRPFDGNSSAERLPPTPLEKKAKRIERRIAREPEDPKLLIASMRVWIGAGNDRVFKAREASRPFPYAVVEDFKAGLQAWRAYLRQTGGEAKVDNAELAAGTYVNLLELGSTDIAEIESNAAGAARAEQIAGRQRQNLYTLSNVAVYDYLNGEYGAGNKAEREAAAIFDEPSRAKIVTEQLDAYRERAETFRKLLKQAAAEARESDDGQLQEPLKAYVASGGLNEEDPTPKPGDD
jgi:hypothetical protein